MLALAVTGFLLLGALSELLAGSLVQRGGLDRALCPVEFRDLAQQRLACTHHLSWLWRLGLAGSLVLGLALQSPAVSQLLLERAQVEQSYDALPNGRFAGHEIAKSLIASHPLGIGPLQFGGHYHQEDVHEVYLNVLLGHGWLGGGAYIIVVALTMVIGCVTALRRGPAQGLTLAALSAYAGTVGEGFIVDTDHWRHFFVLMSILWGIYLAGRPGTGVLRAPQQTQTAPRLQRRSRP